MSSVILRIITEKSDATLDFICGPRVEQMSEVNQTQPF